MSVLTMWEPCWGSMQNRKDSFVEQLFIEHLLCARSCAQHWSRPGEQMGRGIHPLRSLWSGELEWRRGAGREMIKHK